MAKPSSTGNKLDPFTIRRLERFIDDFRARSGQLPTLRDFEAGGFSGDVIERALKDGVIVRYYVTLTNGTVVKGFKKP